MKKILTTLAVASLGLLLCACGSVKPQNIKEMQPSVSAAIVESEYNLAGTEITNMEITKRDTINADDTVWFKFTSESDSESYTGEGTASLHLYTEGGWQLESVHIDNYVSSPKRAPTAEEFFTMVYPSDWRFGLVSTDASTYTIECADMTGDYSKATIPVETQTGLPYAWVTYTGGLTHKTGDTGVTGNVNFLMEYVPVEKIAGYDETEGVVDAGMSQGWIVTDWRTDDATIIPGIELSIGQQYAYCHYDKEPEHNESDHNHIAAFTVTNITMNDRLDLDSPAMAYIEGTNVNGDAAAIRYYIDLAGGAWVYADNIISPPCYLGYFIKEADGYRATIMGNQIAFNVGNPGIAPVLRPIE